MIWYHIQKKESNDTWALSSVALMNSGGIRASTQPGWYCYITYIYRQNRNIPLKKRGSKDQGSIQSSAIPDLAHYMGK